MRKVQNQQLKPGELAIKDIQLDPKSRDDIVKVLLGLQHLYTKKKKKLFKILEKHFRPKTDHDTGRPGMDIWKIFVLGVLKQVMGCDLDRIHNLANSHREVREMMGMIRLLIILTMNCKPLPAISLYSLRRCCKR